MNIRKLAAIDIGSNAMRLLINYVYEFPGSQPIFNKTSLIRLPVRLGEDVFFNKRISEQNEQRMKEAIQAYKLIMDIHGIEDYLAYATSAMRESENGKEILSRIRKKTGIHVEIIDGNTEANLVFATELQKFIEDKQNYLFVDVGGGSTELTLIENGKIGISKSFSVGTVRLLNDLVNPEVYPEMKSWVTKNIRHKQVQLIGSGGNINHVYKYSGIKLGKPMDSSYLRKQYRTFKELTYEERLRDFNMKTDRADVIEYALDIFTKIMKWSHAKKIHVPKIGISDGMIRKLYEEVS
jgi:exopolyphosphatase/guanosine-5'-triphosphate,3'-diphosphate pyrophosphatase